jgi:hypothetical protein
MKTSTGLPSRIGTGTMVAITGISLPTAIGTDPNPSPTIVSGAAGGRIRAAGLGYFAFLVVFLGTAVH